MNKNYNHENFVTLSISSITDCEDLSINSFLIDASAQAKSGTKKLQQVAFKFMLVIYLAGKIIYSIDLSARVGD